uniref:Uncharacterized protein n=1 Tax=Sus scrofa TaxID=9823 RepID=A0A8D1QKJ3_PIG
CNFRCWGKVGLQAFQRVSLHVPLGVLSCEVPGGDCPSQYHREVLHQELAAQRCLHGDPSDGVLGPRGCGGRRSPLVGHPPGCTGWAAGAGAAGAAHVEVWLLPSEWPELIFPHQLSPGPSGRAALGRGSWGSRDCGMGFFKRARYRYPEATVPQYHAVKIPREDRQQYKEEKTGTILRNNWGSPRREGPDAHPILAGDGHPELGSDGHPVPGTA